MNPSSPVLARTSALAGFAAMALAGWNLAGDASRAPTATAGGGEVSKAAVRTERTARNSGPPAHVRLKLAAIRNAGSSKERMRATIELANSLPLSELGDWLDHRWFESVPGFDATLFKKITAQRWRDEDPEGQLLWSMKNGSGDQGTIAAWIKTDPKRVMAFFKEHPNDQMEINALAEIAKSDPGMALAHFKDMIARGYNDNSGGYYAGQMLLQLAEKSPAALEAALESLPGQFRDQAEGMLIGQRMKTDFATEIRKLWARPDGWRIFERTGNEEFGTMLLGELGSLPESWKASLASNYHRVMEEGNAQKWLEADLEGHGFSAEQAKRMRMGALQQITYRKPELALKFIGDMDLSEDERKSTISNIFSYGRNEDQAASLMALLTTDSDREIAEAALAANSSQQQAETKIEKPSDWLTKAAALDPNTGNAYQFIRMLQQWDKEKMATLAADFRALTDEQKAPVAKLIAAGSSYGGSPVDPVFQGEALRYLIDHPPEKDETQPHRQVNPVALASTHAVMWGAKDPVGASEWVQKLPSGEAKSWAQKNLAVNWAQYDPDAAQQWVASLPAAARTEVEEFMKKK